MTKQAAQDGEAGNGGYFPQENEPKSLQPHPIEGAVERLTRDLEVRNLYREEDGFFALKVREDDLRLLLSSYKERGEALSEIIDLTALTVVGGDDFDRGVRAARMDAADIARTALSPNPEAGG